MQPGVYRPNVRSSRVSGVANGYSGGVGEAREWFRRRRLTRPRRGGWIAGVCAGFARRFSVPVLLVRVLVILSLFLPGPQVVAYAALWILMPRDRRI
jgi:phage shock protein C